MIICQDKSVGFRALEDSDLQLLYEWRNNTSFRAYFREHREMSLYQIKDWYYSMIKNNNTEMFCIIDLLRDKMVGMAGFTSIDFINRHADIHFYIGHDNAWIDSTYSLKIFPSLLEYGFYNFNFHKLWTEVYAIDSQKLSFFKHFNFQIDASFRDHYFHDGKYHDSHILSLLRCEYEL